MIHNSRYIYFVIAGVHDQWRVQGRQVHWRFLRPVHRQAQDVCTPLTPTHIVLPCSSAHASHAATHLCNGLML